MKTLTSCRTQYMYLLTFLCIPFFSYAMGPRFTIEQVDQFHRQEVPINLPDMQKCLLEKFRNAETIWKCNKLEAAPFFLELTHNEKANIAIRGISALYMTEFYLNPTGEGIDYASISIDQASKYASLYLYIKEICSQAKKPLHSSYTQGPFAQALEKIHLDQLAIMNISQ